MTRQAACVSDSNRAPELIVSNHINGLDGFLVPPGGVPSAVRFQLGERAVFKHAYGPVEIIGPPTHRSLSVPLHGYFVEVGYTGPTPRVQHSVIYYEVSGRFTQEFGHCGYVMTSGLNAVLRDRFFVRCDRLIPTTTTLLIRAWREIQAHN